MNIEGVIQRLPKELQIAGGALSLYNVTISGVNYVTIMSLCLKLTKEIPLLYTK